MKDKELKKIYGSPSGETAAVSTSSWCDCDEADPYQDKCRACKRTIYHVGKHGPAPDPRSPINCYNGLGIFCKKYVLAEPTPVSTPSLDGYDLKRYAHTFRQMKEGLAEAVLLINGMIERDASLVEHWRLLAQTCDADHLTSYANKLDALRESVSTPSPEDVQRLDWLEKNEMALVSHREKLGDGYGIWWRVVKRGKSISGHPLGSVRAAIDAAMAKKGAALEPLKGGK